MISLAYFAGILDVKGSLIIKRGQSGMPRIVVSIYSRTPEVPLLFSERFGGPVVAKYKWHLFGQAAKDCVAQLRPYMVARTKLADDFLSIATPGRGRRKIGGRVRKVKGVKVPAPPRDNNHWKVILGIGG